MADDQIQVVFGADTAGIEAGAKRGTDAVQRFSERMRASGSDAAGLNSAINTLTATVRANTAAINSMGDSLAKVGTATRAAKTGMEEAAKGAESLHMGSSGAIRELIVLAREAGNGNYTRMAGSLSILAQRSGLLTMMLTPLGLSVIGLTVATGAFVFAAVEGAAEMEKFGNSMKATNGYSGMTASSFIEVSKEMGAMSGVGAGKAREALIALANSGRFTGQSMQLVGFDAIKMGQLTGQSTDDMLKQFEQMGSGVAAFAIKYQDQYHQLTAAQVEYIRTLEEQGNKEGAERALAQDIYNYLGTQAPQKLGVLQTAWKDLGEVVSDAWEAMKSVGRDKTELEQIQALQSQYAYYDRMKASGGVDRGAANAAQAQILAQINGLNQVLEASQKIADTKAKDAQVQTAGVDAAARLHEQFENSRSSGEKLHQVLQKINQDLAAAEKANPGNTAQLEKEAAADRADAIEKYTPKTKKPKADKSDMAKLEADFEAQENRAESANGGMLVNMEADAVKYWGDLLKGTIKNEADKEAIRKRYESAVAAVSKQNAQDIVAAGKTEEEAAIRTAETTFNETKRKLEDEISDAHKAVQEKITSRQNGLAQIKALIDQEAKAETAAAVAATNARIAYDQLVLTKYKGDTEEAKKAARDMEQAKADLAQKSADIQIQADERRAKAAREASQQQLADFQKMSDQMSASFAHTTSSLILGQTTFQKVGQQLEAKALTAFIQTQTGKLANYAITQSGLTADTAAGEAARATIERSWLGKALALFGIKLGAQVANQSAQTGATAAGNAARAAADATGAAAQGAINAATVTSNAAVAGSGAAAAVAATPFIGPELALTEGAATMASVEGMFGSVAFAASGWGEVPYDNMPTLLHKKEMVLPAQYATPLRAMLSGMHLPNLNMAAAAAAPLSAVSNAYGGGGGGSKNMNISVSAMDGKSVQRTFEQHGDKMVKALQRATRNTRGGF